MRKGWYFWMGLVLAGCASDSGSGGDNFKECRDGADGETYLCPLDSLCHGGECVRQDDENCGAVGYACVNGNTCVNGVCSCATAPETEQGKLCTLLCSADGCVDFKSNPAHCGVADVACDVSKGEKCVEGGCTGDCPSNMQDCGSVCADVLNDVRHCGECGTVCPGTGEHHVSRGYCQGGECRVVCEAGYIDEDDDVMTGCETKVEYTCGNGIVEIGEKCDGARLNDQTCATVVGEGSRGTLYCRPDCLGYDASDCTAATSCGNGVIDGTDVCDGAQVGGATCASIVGEGSVGHLGCLANCSGFDTSECSAPTLCGNGVLDAGESCDGGLFGTNSTCASAVGPGSVGTLGCTSWCTVDTSGCSAPSQCGNGRVEDGEVCDGTNFNGATCESLVGKGSVGALKCNACTAILTTSCSMASTCGNGTKDGQDVCDGGDLGGATCESVVGPGSTGTLRCRENCGGFDVSGCTAASTCGNGVVEVGEVCDGIRLNDRTCETEVGAGSTGTLKCNQTCTGFVTSQCTASTTCGNGVLEIGELCDSSNIQGKTCEMLVGPGSTGTVLCGEGCTSWNLSGCSSATQCGNGSLDAGEKCDGELLAGATCASVLGDGATGTLKCDSGCKNFDVSGCTKPTSCGDKVISGSEVCDSETLGGHTCSSVVGYGSKGILACNETCSGFDTSKCSAEVTCGNGRLESFEKCDGALINGATCSSLVGYGSTGTPVCNSTCTGFETTLDGKIQGCTDAILCGNGKLDEGEVCDGALLNGRTCETQVGYGSTGLPGCNSTCTGYTNGTCTAAQKCGNGKLDSGEICDGSFLNGKTCADVVGVGSTGTLLCDASCNFNTTHCSASRGCGNGTLEDGEPCDGTTFVNDIKTCNKYAPSLYSSGKLSCTAECRVDTSACTAYCGNGSVNVSINGVDINEACDHGESGDKFPSSANSCAKVVGTGSTGTLSCSEDCKTIITTQCTPAVVCGDGVVGGSEACDGSAFASGKTDCSAYSSEYKSGTSVSCLSNCTVDTSACVRKDYCGDGVINGEEECDGANFLLGGTLCSQWDAKYGAGNVSCGSDCKVKYDACVLVSDMKKCGNGVLDETELCDGTKFFGDITSCAVYSAGYVSGTLKCTPECAIDESACVAPAPPVCGDGNIDDGEVCDGKKLPFDYTACNKYDAMLYEKGTVKCSADCKSIDVSGCVLNCGNGSVNTTKGEVCDHSESGDKFSSSANTCAKVVGTGSTGTLACSEDCRTIITTGCSEPVTCGNGVVDGDEDCDGTKFLMDETTCKGWSALYESGTVTCNPDCTVNFSQCKAASVAVCGDGIVNQVSEDCDGASIATGLSMNCENWSDEYTGTAKCGADCKVDLSSCVLKPVSLCGNGKVDETEECDGTSFKDDENQCSDWGAFASGTLKCNASCKVDTSSCKSNTCGDGVVGGSEECDGSAFLLGVKTCADYSSVYSSGNLKCTSGCTVDTSSCVKKCGNGIVDSDEFCDPGLDGKTPVFDAEASVCDIWITGTTGTLACTSTCEVDTSACKAKPTAYCGDGVVNTAAEECDGSAFMLDIKNCAEYSKVYTSGTLTCNPDCTVNVSACVAPKCGDGILDESEYCDGSNFVHGIKTCAEYSPSYSSGVLKCDSKCNIDTSGCTFASMNTCGNGKLEEDELCDGALFVDGASKCTDWGDFASGNVTCTSTCDISTAECIKSVTAKCGDGVINTAAEECDGSAFLFDVTACKDYSSAYASGNLKCNANCTVNTSSCVAASSSTCGNGILEYDEACDGSLFMLDVDTCAEYNSSYKSGALTCNSNCTVNTSACVGVCTGYETRCVGNVLQMCDNGKGWEEMEICSGTKPVCPADGEDGECVKAAVDPVDLQWCTFHWLETSANNIGYGRILLPGTKTTEDVLAYMACTNDLSKPVSSWQTVDAVLNPSCSSCGANKEFMTEKAYAGASGTNYCTFIFDFLEEGMFACRPQQEGASAPILITVGSTTLTADLTRQFTNASSVCTEGDLRCNGSNLELCDSGAWVVYETCEVSQSCSVAEEGCVSAGYDHTVTMTNWYTSDQTSYTSNKTQTFSDGTSVKITGAFYVSVHVIDGVTAILRPSKSTTGVDITGLSMGVGSLSFNYAMWSSSDASVTFEIKAGGTTVDTLTVAKGTTSVQTYTKAINASVSSVSIVTSGSSDGRLLVDNIRFTSK